jgi:hypothetical protein
MAAIVNAVTPTASTSNASGYTSSAFTPATDDLLVVLVVATATTAAGTCTGSAGLTFTRVATRTKNGSADTLYAFVADAPATAGSQTVTFSCAGDNATGCVLFVARVSGLLGLYGAAAVRQSSGQSNAAAGTPSATFALPVVASNPTIAFIANATNPATMTPPINWTERADSGYASPATGAEYASRDSGFAGTTIPWGSASASAFGDIVLELAATKLVSTVAASGSGVGHDESGQAAPVAPVASGTGTAYAVPARVDARARETIVGTGIAADAGTDTQEELIQVFAAAAVAAAAAGAGRVSLGPGSGYAAGRSM